MSNITKSEIPINNNIKTIKDKCGCCSKTKTTIAKLNSKENRPLIEYSKIKVLEYYKVNLICLKCLEKQPQEIGTILHGRGNNV
jgi:hypothetical protein